ncbi:MAG: DUF1931 domain-containing protein [Candidatus Woesearchaeota archaeon]
MPDSVIVKVKIKEYAKIDDKPLNVSLDFADALNKEVISIIKKACQRAKDNGRNTVMVKDL